MRSPFCGVHEERQLSVIMICSIPFFLMAVIRNLRVMTNLGLRYYEM